MALHRSCDVCRASSLTVKRYGVSRQARLNDDPARPTSYGRGGIDMCDACWDRICKPKTRPQRARKYRIVNVVTSNGIMERLEPAPETL